MRETIFLPKPKGVKKGWIKHVGAISQNRFLVFPISEKRGITDKVFRVSKEIEKPVFQDKTMVQILPTFIIDLKDPFFKVEPVTENVSNFQSL